MRNEISDQLQNKENATKDEMDDMVEQVQIATQKKLVLKHLATYLKKRMAPGPIIQGIAEKSVKIIRDN